MQRLFTFLLIALVLAHATLGCCAHHVHAGAAPCCTKLSANEEHDHCSGHGDHGHGQHEHGDEATPTDDGDEGNDDSSRSVPQRCNGSTCNFARTETSPERTLLPAGDFLSMADQSATCRLHFTARNDRAPSFESGATSQSRRRHLVLAVLLI